MRIENKPTRLKYKNFIFELKLFMRFEKRANYKYGVMNI